MVEHHPSSSVIDFLQYLQSVKRGSVHTIKSYGEDIRFFSQFILEQFSVEDPLRANALMVRSWIAEQSSLQIAPATIRRRISALQSYYKYCCKKGLLENIPSDGIPLPKMKKRLPVYLEEQQMDRLFQDVPFPPGFEGATAYLCLVLLSTTGLRRSELTGITWRDFDWSRSLLRVMGKGGKERLLPLLPVAQELAKEYQGRIDRPVPWEMHQSVMLNEAGAPLTDQQLYYLVKKYLSKVSTQKKRSPHVLRHSFATHLTNNGAELQAVKELLGHSSLAATQVYTHNSIAKLKEAHKKAHPKG